MNTTEEAATATAAEPTLPFVAIPDDLLRTVLASLDLDTGHLFLLVYQHTHGKRRRRANLSYEDIAALSQLRSPKRILRAIRNLHATGLATYTAPFAKRNRRKTGTFTLETDAVRKFTTPELSAESEENNLTNIDKDDALSKTLPPPPFRYPDYSVADGEVDLITGFEFYKGWPVYPGYPHDLDRL